MNLNINELINTIEPCARQYIQQGGELYSLFIGKTLTICGQKMLVVLDPDMETDKLIFLNRHDTVELINLKDDYEPDYDFDCDRD